MAVHIWNRPLLLKPGQVGVVMAHAEVGVFQLRNKG